MQIGLTTEFIQGIRKNKYRNIGISYNLVTRAEAYWKH